MALTDALIGDKPVKVEINLSNSTRNVIVFIGITFFLATAIILSTVKSQTK